MDDVQQPRTVVNDETIEELTHVDDNLIADGVTIGDQEAAPIDPSAPE